MGKQNFLQGGFTGKVGAFVGQGWKDTLVIKSYTKPSNPRTANQNKMRAGFAARVAASKLAMAANYGVEFFNDAHSGQWGARMKTASQLFDPERNILEYAPLIPYGYAPAYVATDEIETTSSALTLAFDTEDDIGGRALSVLVYALNVSSQEYETQLLAATVAGSAGAWTCTATLPSGYEIGEESYCAAVSRDDAAHDQKCVYAAPAFIGVVLPVVTFTLSNPVVTGFAQGDSGYLFTLTPSVTLPDTELSNVSATCRGVLQGEFVTGSLNNFSFVANGTLNLGDFENLDSLGQRPMFVSGSTLTVSPFSFVADGTRYKFAGATFDLAETPTEQHFILQSSVLDIDENGIDGTVAAVADTKVSENLHINVTQVLDNGNISTGRYILSTTINAGLQAYYEEPEFYMLYGSVTQSCALLETFKFKAKGVTYYIDTTDAITLRGFLQEKEINLIEDSSELWVQSDGTMYWDNLNVIYSGATWDFANSLPASASITINGTTYTWDSGWQVSGTNEHKPYYSSKAVSSFPTGTPAGYGTGVISASSWSTQTVQAGGTVTLKTGVAAGTYNGLPFLKV